MLLTRTGQCLHQLLEAEVAIFMSQGWQAPRNWVEVELIVNCINYLLPYSKQPRRGDYPLYHSLRQHTNIILKYLAMNTIARSHMLKTMW